MYQVSAKKIRRS